MKLSHFASNTRMNNTLYKSDPANETTVKPPIEDIPNKGRLTFLGPKCSLSSLLTSTLSVNLSIKDKWLIQKWPSFGGSTVFLRVAMKEGAHCFKTDEPSHLDLLDCPHDFCPVAPWQHSLEDREEEKLQFAQE